MAKKSKGTRFAEARSRVAAEGEEFRNLRDELEEWFENMPENLQSGSKAEQIQEAIDQLEEVIDSIEGIEYTEIEFPGAFG